MIRALLFVVWSPLIVHIVAWLSSGDRFLVMVLEDSYRLLNDSEFPVVVSEWPYRLLNDSGFPQMVMIGRR